MIRDVFLEKGHDIYGVCIEKTCLRNYHFVKK